MKSKLSVAVALILALCVSGCASRTTSSGGKETSLLAGVMTISEKSFQPITPATIDTDVSMMAGKGAPSGNKVTLFWGLMTFHDY
jgi:outer membrane lipoprotein SlyB